MTANHGDRTRCSATAMRKAMRRLTQLYDDYLQPTGLTLTQFGIMTELLRHEAKPPTVTELADAMVMDRSGLGHTLRPMERDGYISLVQDKNDGRRRSVVLTEAGRSLQKRAAPFWEKAQSHYIGVVGQEAKAELHERLLAIAHDERLRHSD
jgi:DNA-binding MarR family transcriptional regulator